MNSTPVSCKPIRPGRDHPPWQHAPFPLGEIRRVRHANNRDGAAWTGIPQRKRRSAKQQFLAGHSDSAKAFSFFSDGRLKMNDQQKSEQDSGAREQEIRAALDQHWAASDANDFETEHLIYHEDAVLD